MLNVVFVLVLLLVGASFNSYAFKVENLADPSVTLTSDGLILLTGTNRRQQSINAPLYVGDTIAKLQEGVAIDAMPRLPSWAEAPVWGSEIHELKSGYAIYFTAHYPEKGMKCIGVAHSSKPTGPFITKSDVPLLCPLGVREVIAPAIYAEGDELYLLYKQNAGGGGGNPNTAIWLAQLNSGGTEVVGRPVRLLNADLEWEHGNIESPTLIKRGPVYYLFYAGAYFDRSSYGVGYAMSDRLFGPYAKPSGNKIIGTDDLIYAPGSQGVIKDKCGRYLIFFHAYDNAVMRPPRNTYVRRLIFDNRLVSVKNVVNESSCDGM